MILVYGASGLTGTLVTQKLLERGAEVAISGRDESRLRSTARRLDKPVEIRPAQVHDPSDLASAFQKMTVIVNCAGPYLAIGEPIVTQAIESGIPYIDIAAEQRFLRRIYEQKESAARNKGVTVVNGMGFQGALGDWACALAAARLSSSNDAPSVSEVVIAYSLDRFRPSKGVQKSMLAQMEEPADAWQTDRWEPLSPMDTLRRFIFPEDFGERDAIAFPANETITVPRWLRADKVVGFLALAGDAPYAGLVNRIAAAVTPALPALLRSPLGALAYAQNPPASVGPNENNRKNTRFAIMAELKHQGTTHRVAMKGGDPYELSAEICTEGALALAGRDTPAGVLAPSEAFRAKKQLGNLADKKLLELYES